MSTSTSKRYPVELRERAARMVAEVRGDYESEWAAMTRVAELLGVGTPETVRKWVRQAEVDAGSRPGVTSEDSAEVKRLKRENAELRRANAILKAPLQDLDLHVLHPDLATEPDKLRPLVASQTFLDALVDVGLAHPVPQAALADPEVLGDLSNGLLPQPSELDRATPELRRVWGWH